MQWIVLAILAFVVIGAFSYGVGLYNGLIRLKHAVERSWANIDVLLKQRHEELPKVVDTVKGYIAHEREVLEAVTKARSAFQQARGTEEMGRADSEIHRALGRLFAVAEGYPELKADSAFQMLQERIAILEDGIADRREFFNHSVNALNVRIEQIPDVFLANLMGLRPHALFEVAEGDRQDVKISFSN